MINKNKIAERLKSLKLSHVITMVIFAIIFVGAIFGIIEYQNSQKNVIEPTVKIVYPIDGDVTNYESTILEGRADSAKEVFVNGEEIEINIEGEFVKEITLFEGENVITVIAKNGSKESEQTINVRRTEPMVYEEVVPVSVGSTEPVSNLSSSGPETLWIPEITALSLVGVSWYGSRKKLKKAIRK